MSKLERIILAGGILFIILMLIGLVLVVKSNAQDRRDRYIECKTKTTDIEWCGKTIYGITL